MSVPHIERTAIWKNTLASYENDEYRTERERLRTAFYKLRENSSFLVDRISSILPELTQHEISHLDALWETVEIPRI